jgi:hypothetical protein
MQRTQARERIAREADFEDVFVATSHDMDERTRTGKNKRGGPKSAPLGNTN